MRAVLWAYIDQATRAYVTRTLLFRQTELEVVRSEITRKKKAPISFDSNMAQAHMRYFSRIRVITDTMECPTCEVVGEDQQRVDWLAVLTFHSAGSPTPVRNRPPDLRTTLYYTSSGENRIRRLPSSKLGKSRRINCSRRT